MEDWSVLILLLKLFVVKTIDMFFGVYWSYDFYFFPKWKFSMEVGVIKGS